MSNKTSLSKLMDPRHLKVVRTLGYVLTLGSRDSWFGLVPVFMARMTVQERAALAFMALKALDRETAAMTVDAALAKE